MSDRKAIVRLLTAFAAGLAFAFAMSHPPMAARADFGYGDSERLNTVNRNLEAGVKAQQDIARAIREQTAKCHP